MFIHGLLYLHGLTLLTLTLELWQNDIFLILMWNNFTICRIMQLIFRNRNCEMSIMQDDDCCALHALFREIKQCSTFTIWLWFWRNLPVPSRYTYINSAAGYSSKVCIRFFFWNTRTMHRRSAVTVCFSFHAISVCSSFVFNDI